MFRSLLIIIAVCITTALFGQSACTEIDKLFDTSQPRFNGVVVLARGNKVLYSRAAGSAFTKPDAELTTRSRFIIGSVSKQITAVLVLQAYEIGLVNLHTPIGQYLPGLPSWRDSVTIHHLLTHTHGIDEDSPSKPLSFAPGSRFEYSQVGYDLLAKILERVTGKTFAGIARAQFSRCGMNNTGDPAEHMLKTVQGCFGENGNVQPIDTHLYIPPVAAGNFISTAEDLLKWNNCLHTGKLLRDSTYRMMVTIQPNAIRQHPIFGRTLYGYGITIDNRVDLLQVGQTGMRAGFNSMNFYFPGTNTSIIILSNVQYDGNDAKKSMAFHTSVLDVVRKSLGWGTKK